MNAADLPGMLGIVVLPSFARREEEVTALMVGGRSVQSIARTRLSPKTVEIYCRAMVKTDVRSATELVG